VNLERNVTAPADAEEILVGSAFRAYLDPDDGDSDDSDSDDDDSSDEEEG
jgi:hypothetical protein